jgi:GT2 family glycosyltransferase
VTTPPDLTTVVVSWNTVDLLDECLGSIVEATPAGLVNEIVVVDNGSADGSADHVRRRWPDVRVIANEQNVGFCRANNQAIRESSAPLLLLVNTDARLRPGGIEALLRYFDTDPRAAVVGPRLEYGDGTFQRWTAGRPLSTRSLASYLLALDRVTPLHPFTEGIYLARDTREPFQPGWVSSAVMAIRRAALDEVGPLDENIFVYMDDVDLCHRVRAGGWNVWYAADTTAVHLMGASTRRVTGKASPEALRALNRWYARVHGRRAAQTLRALEVTGFGLRAAAYGARSLVHRSPDARARTRAQMRAHAAHLRLALEPLSV